jgi:predicted enzyme related to lactoylglutathione lyase
MAKKKSVRKKAPSSSRKAAKKGARTSTKKSAQGRSTAARRPAARRPAAASRNGVITHTELASADPAATRAWCESVLGWEFIQAMPTPTGPYHMWRFGIGTGGGIRAHNPPEVPGSIPYCEVASIQDTYSRALSEGAHEMVPPMALPQNMGWIAIVAAPGGVPIGFWSMRL